MLYVLIFVFVLGYWIGKSGSSQPSSQYNFQSNMLQRIINALVAVARKEITNAKSKETKEALQRVIDAGYIEQYGRAPDQALPPAAQSSVESGSQATISASSPGPQVQMERASYQQGPNLVQQTPSQQALDNTSLLLYFGAFLFITSIGLFVAFAEVNGTLRALLVAVVVASMYSFGYWLHGAKKKLQQVGLTFIGIGMASLPFVGLAVYYYMLDEQFGAFVWFATSLASIGLYVLSLLKLRNSFVSYMLIASIVSLFMSSVSILDAPLYYYVWTLVVLGIVLQFLSLVVKQIPDLEDASAQSARLLVPLTLFASLFIVSSEGSGQLAVSLLLGALYYGLQYFQSETDKEYYALSAHALTVGAIGFGAFALSESLRDVSFALMATSLLHGALILAVRNVANVLYRRLCDVALITALSTIAISLVEPLNLLLAVISMIVLSTAVTVRTRRDDSFGLSIVFWVVLSLVLGQVYLHDSFTDMHQIYLSFGFTLPLIGLLFLRDWYKQQLSWHDTIMASIFALHVLAFGFAFAVGEYTVLIVSAVAIVNAIVLNESLRENVWSKLAVGYSLVPSLYVVYVLNDDYLRSLPLFTLSTVGALLVNILLALRYRIDAARWANAAGWIALPFALGIEEVGGLDLSANLQMWLYLAAGLALLTSRAIARGRLLLPKHTNLASLERERSVAYEIGLILTTVITMLLAFVSVVSVLESTLVIILAGVFLVAGGTVIERSPQYISITPIIVQVALLRLLEPYTSASWLSDSLMPEHAYVLTSSAVAIAMYAIISLSKHSGSPHFATLQQSILATTFIAPLSFIIFGQSIWVMPVTLLFAVAALLHYQWRQELRNRELIGYLGIVAVFWLMFEAGIENIQAYTHVLAALFALYGYIRHRHSDMIGANNYWGAMLGVATIPLALQALGGSENSDIYGILLLLENVMFLIIGVLANNRLITRWGLYFAVASVLYQLRGLGWAMLSLLALFIIGVGAWRAFQQSDDS